MVIHFGSPIIITYVVVMIRAHRSLVSSRDLEKQNSLSIRILSEGGLIQHGIKSD